MTSYGNYTCVPFKNNYWWLIAVFWQFVIVILGCISHVYFMRLVVIRPRFGFYTRLTFAMISAQMLNMLLTSTGAFLITLSHGKLIEDCEISSIELRKWLLYIHSFGEYFFVVCELLSTIERFASTYIRVFRKSDQFPTVFFVGCVLGAIASVCYIYLVRIAFDKTMFAIGFGSLTLMEIVNGILVLILLKVAIKKYRNDQEATLNARYEFAQSYTYSRCAVASVMARVVLLTYVYLKLAGFFDGDLDSPFFYIMNIFINGYCLVYPWTIMLSHRKINSQIRRHFKSKFACLRRGRIQQEGESRTLYTIDGRPMKFGTTEEHFQQLNECWEGPPSPPTKRSKKF